MTHIPISNFPTRERLRDVMNLRVGAKSEILLSIISVCAEEAESEMLNFWRTRAISKEVTMRKNITQKVAHFCTNCKTLCIYTSHKYCSQCGAKIIWK